MPKIYIALRAAPARTSRGDECAFCRLAIPQGARIWLVHRYPDCLPWAHEMYCQDCYNYLYYHRGLKRRRFPHPVQLWVLLQWEVNLPKRWTGASYKLQPFWGPWPDVDRFRRLAHAIKGGFTAEGRA